MSVKFSKSKALKVFKMFDGRCAYCGKELSLVNASDNNYLTIDHINSTKPKNNNITNLFPCCKSCNSTKSTKDLEYFRLYLNLKEVDVKFSVKQYEYLIDNGFDLLSGIDKIKFYFEVCNVL